MSADLSRLSAELAGLVESVKSGVAAVDVAHYRVASGVAIGEDLIAVANHSLRREPSTTVWTTQGGHAKAAILGREPTLDLAVLRVEGAAFQPILPSATDSLQAGMLAVVVGMTKDVGPSVSLGVLGAVGHSRTTWRGGTLDQFLRVDANLYPSQSGAAVIDTEGRLIGLATGALSRHSVIAIPTATIGRIAGELKNEGRIRRGYIGVGVQPVELPSKLRERSGITAESGLMLMSVEADSPAERAGSQIGDILIALEGKPVSDIDELQAELRGENVGRSVKATVIRGGEAKEVVILIGERGDRNK